MSVLFLFYNIKINSHVRVGSSQFELSDNSSIPQSRACLSLYFTTFRTSRLFQARSIFGANLMVNILSAIPLFLISFIPALGGHT